MNKVLIVDDDILVQKALKKIIEMNENFQVVDMLSSGDAAIKYCEKTTPDLIFMDIMLPGINGLLAAKQIKKILPKIDIYIISTYQNLNFVKQALKLEIKEYLLKPISAKAIKMVLKDYQPEERNYEEITNAIKQVVEAKDYHLVFTKPREIVKQIFKYTGQNKESIGEVLRVIEKNLLTLYFGNPFEQTNIFEQFPINMDLLDDAVVVEMWISKVLDYVYKHRFTERYPSAKLVFEYIDEHVKEYISMLSIIDNCHISQQYILRLFKEQMKMSTLDYIQNRKIMLAKWYFYLGEYSTLDVSVMLGYSDVGYFSKIFKKYEGITAYQYKSNLEALKQVANDRQ